MAIICEKCSNCTVEKTLKASPFNSRGYAVPPDRWIRVTSTLKGSPTHSDGRIALEYGRGDPFRVVITPYLFIRRSYRPAAIERRRFQRLKFSNNATNFQPYGSKMFLLQLIKMLLLQLTTDTRFVAEVDMLAFWADCHIRPYLVKNPCPYHQSLKWRSAHRQR